MTPNAPHRYAPQAFLPIQLGADCPEALVRTLDEFLAGMATQGMPRDRFCVHEAGPDDAFMWVDLYPANAAR